ATASMPRRVARAFEQLLAAARARLDVPFDQALDAFDRRAVQLAARAPDPVQQSAHLAIRDEVRRHRTALFPAFLRELEAGLATIREHARAGARGGRPPVHRQLSLVDDEQLDEEARLRDIAARQDVRASLHLHLLGQRFGVLARDAAFDAARLPLGPRALVHALRDAAQSLGIGSPARRLLAEAFDESVMAGYEGLAKRFDVL